MDNSVPRLTPYPEYTHKGSRAYTLLYKTGTVEAICRPQMPQIAPRNFGELGPDFPKKVGGSSFRALEKTRTCSALGCYAGSERRSQKAQVLLFIRRRALQVRARRRRR